jgi:hypothetical protein
MVVVAVVVVMFVVVVVVVVVVVADVGHTLIKLDKLSIYFIADYAFQA